MSKADRGGMSKKEYIKFLQETVAETSKTLDLCMDKLHEMQDAYSELASNYEKLVLEYSDTVDEVADVTALCKSYVSDAGSISRSNGISKYEPLKLSGTCKVFGQDVKYTVSKKGFRVGFNLPKKIK